MTENATFIYKALDEALEHGNDSDSTLFYDRIKEAVAGACILTRSKKAARVAFGEASAEIKRKYYSGVGQASKDGLDRLISNCIRNINELPDSIFIQRT